MEEKNYVGVIDIGLSKINYRNCNVELKLILCDYVNNKYIVKSVINITKRDIHTTSEAKKMHIINILKLKFGIDDPQNAKNFLGFLRVLTMLFLEDTYQFKDLLIRYEIGSNEVMYINRNTKEILNNESLPSIKKFITQKVYKFNRSVWYDQKEVDKFNKDLIPDNNKLKLYKDLFHFISIIDLDQLNGGK